MEEKDREVKEKEEEQDVVKEIKQKPVIMEQDGENVNASNTFLTETNEAMKNAQVLELLKQE